MAFSFQVTTQEHAATVSVHGELDMDTAPRLADALDDLIERAGVTDMTLSLGDVTFMDSSGLQAVLRTKSKVPGRLVVATASDIVQRVFEIAGVERLIEN